MNTEDNNLQNLQNLKRYCISLFKPPPKINVSTWADKNRFLSSESSAEPGKWSTARAPYQEGILNVFLEDKSKMVVFMASSQVGKTEIINNMIGFLVEQDPCPILVLQPTLEIAQAWSRDRFDPMVRDSPVLREKIKTATKDKTNRVLNKKFPGGHITMVGANSAAGLAARPIKAVFLDEIDRYPQSAGTEGDPISLAIKRTVTFWDKKIFMASTPTIKGESKIEELFLKSDQRKYYVPCPHCDFFQTLRWENMRRPSDDATPEDWGYFCESCGCEIEEKEKMSLLKKGEWRKTAETSVITGFFINELYSPWVSWTDMVRNFLESKKLPDTLKTFVNTSLGETWDVAREGVGVKAVAIHERAEDYKADVPKGVLLLTAAVDVQVDRLEVEVLGWGMNKETWSIAHEVVWGDPVHEDVWDRLTDFLMQKFEHEEGVRLRIQICVIDTGGSHTEQVYKYIKARQMRKHRVYGVKGSSQKNRPVIDRVSRNNVYRLKLFFVGTDTAKDIIYSYLKIKEPGPGYMHHPAHYKDEYFRQLTSERKKTVYDKGKKTVKWILPPNKKNEALDLKVYNFAAFAILKQDMASLKIKFEAYVRKQNEPAPVEKKMSIRKL